MRGKTKTQPEFLTIVNLNQRVPAGHPLRGIKEHADKVLTKLSPLFDELYAEEGRPSIPPEQLLKSRILMALYSVRSERLFCEQLAYNLLWLWFLDRELDEGSFDPTVFTHNYERVLSADAAKLFFVEVYDLSRAQGCRQRGVSPHAACKQDLQVSGWDQRTTARNGYRISQRIRKRVEEIFGWMKTIGGLRRNRYRGIDRTQAWAYFVAGTYNLLRITRLGLSLQTG